MLVNSVYRGVSVLSNFCLVFQLNGVGYRRNNLTILQDTMLKRAPFHFEMCVCNEIIEGMNDILRCKICETALWLI